jgi:AraC family transcriptional regulator of adaptative response/methylated-DNA-[protein]-cysteine methyltransferase
MVKIVLTERQKSDDLSEIIYWGRCATEFGADAVLGWTDKGVRWLGFGDKAESDMRRRWSVATFKRDDIAAGALWVDIQTGESNVTLDLHGTAFQIKVWQELLRIQAGKTLHYGDLAQSISQPNASRAVGSAVGKNPVSLLVPCHRVVPANGGVGNYAWGSDLKRRMLVGEGAFS